MMAASRPHTFFKAKKPADFFKISHNIKFKIDGTVVSACLLPKNQLAVLLKKSNQTFIQIVDLKTQKPISEKTPTPRTTLENTYGSIDTIIRLHDGNIFCGGSANQYIFHLALEEFSKLSSEVGHYVGMLNKNEIVFSGPSGFSVISLDKKIPPIRVELPYYPHEYQCDIWPNETIAVDDTYLRIYQRKEGQFTRVETIDVGFNQKSIRIGENIIVKHYADKSNPPLLNVWAQEKGKWKPVKGLEYRTGAAYDWTMDLQATGIPNSDMFMLTGDERIQFFDRKTLRHFSVETDFGDAERYDYRDDVSDLYHYSVTVLADGQIALGYEGDIILLTVQPVKELKEEKECKLDRDSRPVLMR